MEYCLGLLEAELNLAELRNVQKDNTERTNSFRRSVTGFGRARTQKRDFLVTAHPSNGHQMSCPGMSFREGGRVQGWASVC